jgi:hypothetical protein
MELACKRRLRILTIYRPCSGLQRDHALEPRDQDLTTQNKGPNPQPISCVPISRYAFWQFSISTRSPPLGYRRIAGARCSFFGGRGGARCSFFIGQGGPRCSFFCWAGAARDVVFFGWRRRDVAFFGQERRDAVFSIGHRGTRCSFFVGRDGARFFFYWARRHEM